MMVDNSHLIKESLLKYTNTSESLFVLWGKGKGRVHGLQQIIGWFPPPDPLAEGGMPAGAPDGGERESQRGDRSI